MEMMMAETKHCSYCGEEVSAQDYEYVGNSRVWCCGSVECNRELRADIQCAYDDAAGELHAEHFGY